MRVGVLALQGAFIEHAQICERFGAQVVELRSAADLAQPLDALILPGGESTAQSLLLHELGMFAPLQALISAGTPTLATCAGLILLASALEQGEHAHLATLPVRVARNGYGRQLGSFSATFDVGEVTDFKAHFIRAPYIVEAGEGVDILAHVDGRIVAVKYRNQEAYAFHPELGGDTRIHENFLRKVGANTDAR